jgi:SAM-dependent methyltransferase
MIVERLDPQTTDDVHNKALHLERYHWAAQHVHSDDVLDIACGLGYGSAMLSGSARAPRVLGVDRSPEAVETAAARHGSDRVSFQVVEDAETVSLGDRRFSTIVSLETLEHLEHPVAFLRRMHALLTPGGKLIVSAPVRENPGDNPFHLHCFKHDTLRAVVSEGFEIETELDQIGHYLTVVARKRDDPSPAWQSSVEPRLTVVLVTYNGLDRVVELLSAIRRFTRTPYEIFAVDNASTDGTRELLSIFQGEPGFKLVKNSKNQECAAATNLAIAATRTEYVVYLCASHSLVVDPGWEEPLVRFMDEHKEIEIAGHVWNPGFSLPSRRYAQGWTPERHGLEKLEHVQGGAWIARRILFDENGFFDQEAYPHGGMDVEFSYRLLSHGKALGRCSAIHCPPSPEVPDRSEGVTVYHPAARGLRSEVRKACGLSPLPEDSSVPLSALERFSTVGRVGLSQGGVVHLLGTESCAGLLSKESFRDVQIRGRIAFSGYVTLELRTPSVRDGADGYRAILGSGANCLVRHGRILARFPLPRPECHFVFEARGSTISLALDGHRVFSVEDSTVRDGQVLVGVEVGEAVLFGVTIEPLACVGR